MIGMSHSPHDSCVEKNPDHDFKHKELFPIREVARLTGVNPITLRAWERRYGLIRPTRTASGHRLYSLSDIETVRRILVWTERGVAVSKVSRMLARAESAPVQSDTALDPISRTDRARWQVMLREAIGRFDEQRLEQVYGQVFSTCSLTVVFEDILMPIWRDLLLDQDTFGCTSEWLFLDAFLQRRVQQRLQLAIEPGTSCVLLAGLPEQDRALELWVAGLLMGSSGHSVRVLPVGQPFEELGLVCNRIRPAALVLFSNSPPAAGLPARLVRLALAIECPVLLAGEAAHLAGEGLAGSVIGCLGSDGHSMRQLLRRFMAGLMDT